MGLGGSVWVDIEGIRSHGGYKGSGIGDRDLGWDMTFKYILDVGLGKCQATKSKNIHAPEVAYGYQKSELDLWEYSKPILVSCTPIYCKKQFWGSMLNLQAG